MDGPGSATSYTDGLYSATFCVWTDLSFANSEKLLDEDEKADNIKAMLKEVLKLDVAMETNNQAQAEIAAELYAHGVIFARKNKYSPMPVSYTHLTLPTIYSV